MFQECVRVFFETHFKQLPYTLSKTNSELLLKIGHPKMKGSSPDHPFSGAMFFGLLQILRESKKYSPNWWFDADLPEYYPSGN